MHKILLALLFVAATSPALAQQVPMASTENSASSFIERNGSDSYSDPSAQVAPGEDAATMEGTTRALPQSRMEHGCHGSERVETPALTN
jgi:hypothetical protein